MCELHGAASAADIGKQWEDKYEVTSGFSPCWRFQAFIVEVNRIVQ